MTSIGPCEIRAALAAILLYYLSGYPLARAVSRTAGGPTACWMLPCSLFVLMGGLFLSRLADLPLHSAGWVAGFCVVAVNALVLARGRLALPFHKRADRGAGEASCIPGHREGDRSRSDDSVRPVEWLLAAAGLIGLLFVGGPLSVHTDGLAHITAIRRSLDGGMILPVDIFYRGGDGTGWDPRMGFLHPLHALTCSLARVDPIHLWRVLPAVFAPGVILAVSGFLRFWVSPGRASDAALVIWILIGSGSGFQWLTRTGYPGYVAYSLALFIASLVLAEATGHGRRRGRPAAIALLVFTGTLIHIVAGALAAFCAGLAVAAAILPRSTGRGSLRNALRAGVGVGAGLLPAALLRMLVQGDAASALHTHPQGLLSFGHGIEIASPYLLLRQAGFAAFLALMLLPSAAAAIRPGRRALLVLLTLIPWGLVLTPVYGVLFRHFSYLVSRLLEIVPAPAVIVLACAETLRRVRTRRFGASLIPLVGVGLAAWVLGNALLSFPEEIRNSRKIAFGVSTPHRYASALAAIPRLVPGTLRPPVVLSDAFSSYAVGAWTGAHVVATLGQHGPPTEVNWGERREDQREMLFQDTDPARLDSLLLAYEIDYVFVNLALPTPSRNLLSRVDSHSLAFAEQRFLGDPMRFPRIYRDADGLVVAVRMPEDSPDEAPLQGEPVAAGRPQPHEPGDAGIPEPTLRMRDTGFIFEPGPILFGGIEAVNIEIPSDPVRPLEEIRIPLQWRRVGEVGADLPLVAHLYVETDPPRPWFWCDALDKPSRNLVQLLEGRLYRNRVPRLPLSGRMSMARLPLGVAVPDTLSIKVPVAGRPGIWRIRLSLVEEAVVANHRFRDFLRDDESTIGPVVGHIRVEP